MGLHGVKRRAHHAVALSLPRTHWMVPVRIEVVVR
jgi:hypothetical protein